MNSRRSASSLSRLARLERKGDRVAGRQKFAARMGLAVGMWAAITSLGLAIGMAGYAYFEGMDATNAFVNAAMILSGMGEFDALTNSASKIFAGCYALMSGLIILIATSFILAPIFHRILHLFHVEDARSSQD